MAGSHAPLIAKKPAVSAGEGSSPKAKPNVASRSPSKTVPEQQSYADTGREGSVGNEKRTQCFTHPIKGERGRQPPMPPPRRVSHSTSKVEAGES